MVKIPIFQNKGFQMNHFKVLLLALTLAFSMTYAKDNGTAITSLNKTLEDYKQAQMKLDAEKMIGYTYPAMFKTLPKKEMVAMLKEGIKSGQMPKVNKLVHKAHTPLKHYSKGLYTLVDYDMDATMDLTPPKDNIEQTAMHEKMKKDPTEMKKFKTFMISMIKSQLGDGIEISSKEGSMIFDIKKKGQYMALNEGAEWKFVEISPMALTTLESVLPDDLVKKEKALFANKISKEEAVKKMMESLSK